MPYDNHGRMWPKFPDICLWLWENLGKNLKQEIDPTGDRTRARWLRSNDVTPRHSGGHLPLDRTAASVPELAVKDLPLGRILMMMMMMMVYSLL